MEVQLINEELLKELYDKATANERMHQNFDLRITAENTSQRMLNALEIGRHVPIHRHLKTSETVICFKGCLDLVFFAEQCGRAERYEELPGIDAGGSVHERETAVDETCIVETARLRVCPREGQYGILVPLGVRHSVVIHEASTILEAKDGKSEK